MTPAKDIIDLLRKEIDTLDTLGERQVSGFALICPPEGQPVRILMIGNATDEASFYKWLRDRLVDNKDQSFGGVRIPTR